MTNTEHFFRDKSVLITGASSGIGEELAVQLGKAGAKLTLAARRRELLDPLAARIAAAGGVRPVVAECDVTNEEAVTAAVHDAVAAWGKLDVVFANAGFGVAGALEDLSTADYERQFDTNVFGVLRTVYASLSELKKTRGNLVLTGSVAGWVATPGMSAYSMSKFAVRALADSITPELARAGVKVTLLSPGFVVSNIRRVDNKGRFRAEAPADPPPGIRMLQVSTSKAVREILRAVTRGKREQIVTGHGKLLVTIGRFAPWLIRGVAARAPLRARRRDDEKA